jgi:hypothetical protein
VIRLAVSKQNTLYAITIVKTKIVEGELGEKRRCLPFTWPLFLISTAVYTS